MIIFLIENYAENYQQKNPEFMIEYENPLKLNKWNKLETKQQQQVKNRELQI